MDNYSFDLQRIFIGDMSPLFLLEIAFRTAVLFLFTLVMLRSVGHRGLGQLSITEFALIIALGSAVGDPMFYPDVPLLHGMLVIFLIVLFQRIVGLLAMHDKTMGRLIDGVSHRLVADGEIDWHGMKHARMTEGELFAELRQEKVQYLGQVRRAYMETDGEVSVFRYDDDEAHHTGKSLLAEVEPT
jgi:uncharacterized membrane protein YcaP (DUF421 family)